MAIRYAVATGNWNSTSTWSTTSGGAAGASYPTSLDTVFISAAVTVTLTANADAYSIYHSLGGIVLGNYKLSVQYGFNSIASGTRSIDFGNGTLEVNIAQYNASVCNFDSSGLTVTPGNGKLIINAAYGSTNNFQTGGKTFTDVYIRLGTSTSSSDYSILGSPTFRLLDIRSVNTAAHSVTLDAGSTHTVTKFVAIGTSGANPLTIKDAGGVKTATIAIPATGKISSSYGQYLDMQVKSSTNTIGGTPYYIGSTSVLNITSTYWLTSDPPKLSTIVDNLTTTPASSSYFSTMPSGGTLPSATTTGTKGGGYKFDTDNQGMITYSTYDIVDDDLVIEISNQTGSSASGLLYMGFGWLTGFAFSFGFGSVGLVEGSMTRIENAGISTSTYSNGNTVLGSLPATPFYIKMRYISSTGKFRTSYSTDGATWLGQSDSTQTLDSTATEHLRAVRLQFNMTLVGGTRRFDVGTINVLPANNSSFFAFFYP